MRIMAIARTSIWERVRGDPQRREHMGFPYTLKHFSGLALPNDKFDDEVAAHRDFHHDYSHYYYNEYEDHDECTDSILRKIAVAIMCVKTCVSPIG